MLAAQNVHQMLFGFDESMDRFVHENHLSIAIFSSRVALWIDGQVQQCDLEHGIIRRLLIFTLPTSFSLLLFCDSGGLSDELLVIFSEPIAFDCLVRLRLTET